MKRTLSFLLLASVLLLSLLSCNTSDRDFTVAANRLTAAGLKGVSYTESEIGIIIDGLILEGFYMEGSITRIMQFMTDITAESLAFAYLYEFSEEADAEAYCQKQALSWRYAGRRNRLVYYGNAEALATLFEQ